MLGATMAKKKEKRMGEKSILDDLEKNSDGKWIVPLTDPITWGKEKISHFEMVEPRAKHLRNLTSDPTMDEILKIVADLAGQSDAAIDLLCMKDTDTVSEFFGAFG